MEEYIEQGFRNPPKGYTNIDLANKSINKLELSVKACSQDTPAHTFSATRWLENAFYSREIIEDDYNKLMTRIKAQTRIFIDKCDCVKESTK